MASEFGTNDHAWEGVVEILRDDNAPILARARLWRRDDVFGSVWGGQLEVPVALRRELKSAEYAISLGGDRQGRAFIGQGPSSSTTTFPTLTGVSEPPFGGVTSGAAVHDLLEEYDEDELPRMIEHAAKAPVEAADAAVETTAPTVALEAETVAAPSEAPGVELPAERRERRRARANARADGETPRRRAADAPRSAGVIETEPVPDTSNAAPAASAEAPPVTSASDMPSTPPVAKGRRGTPNPRAQEPAPPKREPTRASREPSNMPPAEAPEVAPPAHVAPEPASVAPAGIPRAERPSVDAPVFVELDDFIAQTEALARAFLDAVDTRERLRTFPESGFEGHVLRGIRNLVDELTGLMESLLRARGEESGIKPHLDERLIALRWFAAAVTGMPGRQDLDELSASLLRLVGSAEGTIDTATAASEARIAA